MKTLILICSLSFLLCAVSVGQSSQGQPSPASPTTTQQARQGAPSAASREQAAKQEQIRREAEELAALTKSIPADVAAANQGLLPKDIVEKLNRIEKLSKQLRKDLAAQ
jgi:hypothetical protein